MYINGIDYPSQILKAINDGSLVVFVGAGVSKNKPTCLPDFGELVKRIGKLCGKEYSDEVYGSFDQFLGALAKEKKEVKELVVKELDADDLSPNSMHKNIVKLFRDLDSIRIVTTNYDRMLEKACDSIYGSTPAQYNAPAIPSGDDFKGIIHLHGIVDDPQRIIVTDRDFGMAYMLNGFATRFLVKMFQTYTILFVGYSYEDVIVRYLTSSIPADSIKNSYILTTSGNSRKCSLVNLNPIEFPDGCFEMMNQSLERLAIISNRGLLDWHNTILQLNHEAHPEDKETQDEVLFGLKDKAVIKSFIKEITSRDWAEWLVSNDLFNELFSNSESLSEESILWGEWLAKYHLNTVVQDMLTEHHNINRVFSNQIMLSFKDADDNHTNTLFTRYWLLLREKVSDTYIFSIVLKYADERKLQDLMLDAFTCLLSPHFWIEKEPLMFASGERFKPYYRHPRESLIYCAWKDVMGNYINVFAERLLSVGTDIIRSIYNYHTFFYGDSKHTFSIDYLKIEEISESKRYQYLSFISYMLILCCKKLSLNNQDLINHWIEQNLSSSEMLIKRISLFCLREYSALSSDAKLNLLMDNFSIYDLKAREQIFILIGKELPNSCLKTREKLLNLINTDPLLGMPADSDEDKKRTIAYSRYNILYWIKEKYPDIDQAYLDNLQLIEEEYSNFAPREHPELSIGPVETIMGNKSPILSEDLLSMHPNKAYIYIRDFNDDSFIGADRYGLLETLKEAVSRDGSWTVKLMESQISNKDWSYDVWNYLFKGVAAFFPDNAYMNNVFSIIKKTALIAEQPYVVASFIHDYLCSSNSKEWLPTDIANIIKDNLDSLWTSRNASRYDYESVEVRAFNCCAGVITESYIYLLRYSSLWSGIPDWFVSFVEEALINKTDNADVAFMLLRHSAFLFECNHEWTDSKLLALLSLYDRDASLWIASWEGIFFGPIRFSIPFCASIYPHFLENVCYRKKFNDRGRKRFIEIYVLLTMTYSNDPQAECVTKLLNMDSDETDKISFASYITNNLGRMTNEQRNNQWESWLFNYWQLRIRGVPSHFISIEIEEMLEWLLLLEDNYPEAVQLLVETNVDNLNIYYFIDEFNRSNYAVKYPNDSAKLISFLMSHCNKDTMYSSDVILEAVNSILQNCNDNKYIKELKSIKLSFE